MRLIDADKCPCILCEDTRNAHCTYEHRSCEKFCNWINNAAYNTDKVMEELEGLRIDESNYFGVLNIVAEKYDRANEILDDSIEIVKRGGVE